MDCATPPVNPVPAGANQVYWVPSGTMPLVVFSGTTLNVTPEQTEIEIGWMAAFGCKFTTSVKLLPVQIPETGVT